VSEQEINFGRPYHYAYFLKEQAHKARSSASRKKALRQQQQLKALLQAGVPVLFKYLKAAGLDLEGSGCVAGLPENRSEGRNSLLGKVVFVCWVDSSREEGWTRQAAETLDDLRCCSIGRVFADDGKVLTLAGHWTDEENPQRCGGISIPRAAVVSLREVALPITGAPR